MTTIGAYVDALTFQKLSRISARKHWILEPRAQRAALFAGDLLVLLTAGLLAYLVGSALPFSEEATDQVVLVVATLGIAVVWLIAILVSGAHSVRHLRAGVVEYKRVLTATASAAGLFGVACFLLDYRYPRVAFVLWFAIGAVGLVAARFLRRRVMHGLHRRGLLQTPVLVAGGDHHVDAVAGVLRREQWLGYRVIGAVTPIRQTHTATGLPVLGRLDDLVDVIARQDIDAVIFAEGSFETPTDFRRVAWRLEEQNVQMIVVPALTDVSSQRLDVRPVAGLPLLDVDRPRAIEASRWIKRAFDIVGSAFLLLLASPVLLATAVAIRLEDGGPVLFRQKRVGLKGEEFEMLKFRSMCVDAETKLAELQAKNEGAGVLFKMANDPRVTRIGRFIRRFSIDELPQLWNAFRGDMSLIGPRPALPREVAQYDSDTMRRLDVRPGLTGLWQVSGRSNLSWEDTVRLDLYYVDNWSMVQDLMILAKTARAVVGRDGAY